MNINDLSTDQILQIIAIKKKIEKLHAAVEKRVEKLQGKIESIAGNDLPSPSTTKKKRRMSRAGRAAIGAAAKARWAKYRGNGAAAKAAKKPVAKKRRKMSAAARAKFSAIAKARWAKVKASGKKAL
jgi:hypothetical protein